MGLFRAIFSTNERTLKWTSKLKPHPVSKDLCPQGHLHSLEDQYLQKINELKKMYLGTHPETQ